LSNSILLKAFKGFLSDSIGSLILSIVNVLSIPVILFYISNDSYGMWLTFFSIISYFGLADLGIGQSVIRSLAIEINNNNNSKKIHGIIGSALVFYIIISLVILIIGFVIPELFPKTFTFESNRVLKSTYFIALFTAALSLPLSIFRLILIGFEELSKVYNYTNLISILSISISLILLYLGLDTISLAIAFLTNIIFSSLIFWKIITNKFKVIDFKKISFNKNIFKELFSFGGYFQLGAIANSVILNTDNILISSNLGAGMVPTYQFTSKLAQTFSVNIASKLPNSLFPKLTELFSKNKKVLLGQIYCRLLFISVRLAVFGATIIFFINEKFVQIWVGLENYGGDSLSYIFILWLILETIQRGTGAVIYASGEIKSFTYVMILEAILNIIISIYLVNTHGLIGVAFGTIFSKLVCSFWYAPYFTIKKLELRFISVFYKSVLIPIFSSLPSILIGYLLVSIFNIDSLFIIISSIMISNFLFFELLSFIILNNKNIKFKNYLKDLFILNINYF